MADMILEMRGVTKVYSNGFVANKDINFSVEEGEIHALVGENGAGKSTLMKVLFGVETPEEGQILLKGEPIKIDSPLTAIKYGIGMVTPAFYAGSVSDGSREYGFRHGAHKKGSIQPGGILQNGFGDCL